MNLRNFVTFALLSVLSLSAQDGPPKIPETEVKVVDVAEVEAAIKDPKVIVLDVRSPEEFQAGHIKGATNLNYFDKQFTQQLAKLDKSKTYVLHCASGRRSAQALEKIKHLNFSKILHLEGGMNAWEKAGKPVVKEPAK